MVLSKLLEKLFDLHNHKASSFNGLFVFGLVALSVDITHIAHVVQSPI
ncbi:hypothetical protein LCGC14_1035750 [marine sediment metagenome]|uniref:Uncharacterized protein n=1 Tax=marine sediment metagenome TaxID=412755 RepID=A0A0F9MTB1_9ZZZZ